MTGTSSAEEGVPRREFMVAAGAATVVAGAIGATPPTPAPAAVPANEICRMDAVTLVEKIRNKQLSPTEVTEAVLARMEKLNPVLGAFCTPSPDVARAQAKAVEADIMAGRSVGALAGVPVGIKDLALLHHKVFCRECLVRGAEQHGHRGRVLTRATIRRRRMVAIEFGM